MVLNVLEEVNIIKSNADSIIYTKDISLVKETNELSESTVDEYREPSAIYSDESNFVVVSQEKVLMS